MAAAAARSFIQASKEVRNESRLSPSLPSSLFPFLPPPPLAPCPLPLLPPLPPPSPPASLMTNIMTIITVSDDHHHDHRHNTNVTVTIRLIISSFTSFTFVSGCLDSLYLMFLELSCTNKHNN